MAYTSLPRYFVSRAYEQNSPAALPEVFPPAHAIDSFYLASPATGTRELVVAVNETGGLQALCGDNRGAFPPAVQAELAYNELAGARARVIDAATLYLFELELMEQPVEAPGINDPIYLYGTLYGPYPETGETPLAGIEGQLTVTRADLLEGFVQAAQHAFRYAHTTGPVSRCFHMILPADRDEEIMRGEGIVLAYPLLPAELLLSDVANEIMVSQLLYDVVCGLKEDAEKEGVSSPLRSMALPVPNRMALENQLRAQGYEINGDSAVRQADPTKGFSGLVMAVYDAIKKDKIQLPPEGNVDEFLQIAATALSGLAGWPPPRTLALRQRVKPAAVANRRPVEPPPANWSPPATPITQRPKLSAQAGPTAWMQDFINSHHKPGTPSPRLTSNSSVKRHTDAATKKSSFTKQADWMDDFGVSTAKQQAKPERPAQQDEPDWMKDFE